MRTAILSVIGTAALLYLLTSDVGTPRYYLSIFAILVCIYFYSEIAVVLVCMVGFVAWHFTDFASDSWLEFLLLPLIAAACLLRAFFAIPLLQTLFRTRPVITRKNGFDNYFDN